jgi:Flp pilus assembly protein TadG
MHQPHNKNRRRTAVATVELAFLLPLLVFLFAIGVDFARLYNPYVTITNAASSGALYGSQSASRSVDTAGIAAAALADTADLSPAPSVSSSTSTDASGNPYVTVTVTWNFQTVTHFPGVPSSLNITRTVKMRVQPAVPNNS